MCFLKFSCSYFFTNSLFWIVLHRIKMFFLSKIVVFFGKKSYLMHLFSFPKLQYLTDGRRVERVHGVVRTFCRQTSAIDGIRQITSDDLASFQLEMSGGVLANVVLNSQMVGFSQVIIITFL